MMRLKTIFNMLLLFCPLALLVCMYTYYKLSIAYNKKGLTLDPLMYIKNGIEENEQIIDNMIIHFAEKNKESVSLSVEIFSTSGKNYENDVLQPKYIDVLELYKTLPFDNNVGGVWKQGFNITYKESDWSIEKPLHVYVVPHSHNDPGWILTYEDYYKTQTRYIFENMIAFMVKEPRMRFIYAEMSFLYLWWNEATEPKRKILHDLIQRKQLEIVNGAWVMNDEANTHYFAMVDQTQQGNLWLYNKLGVKPRYGWFIDPFGHSSANAYILKRFGFEGTLIQRVHYYLKKVLAQSRDLEFYWRQNWDESGKRDMFTHMMPFYSYDIPHSCGPDPSVCCQFDFNRLPVANSMMSCPWGKNPQIITKFNVQRQAELLLDQYRQKSKLYKTDHLLVPLGDDFRYKTQEEWKYQISNYLALFDWLNSKPAKYKIQVRFATLSEYFDAVLNQSASTAGDVNIKERSINRNIDANSRIKRSEEFDSSQTGTVSQSVLSSFPVLRGDFFTYADRDDNYWSGYYSSRPSYKRLDRILESKLRAAEIFYSIANLNIISLSFENRHTNDTSTILANLYDSLDKARNDLGLFQHHDGITGTARNRVVQDYANRMHEAIRITEKVLAYSINTLAMIGVEHLSNPNRRIKRRATPVVQDNKRFLLNTIRRDPVNETYVKDFATNYIDLNDERFSSNDVLFNKMAGAAFPDNERQIYVVNSLTSRRLEDVVTLTVNSKDVCLFDRLEKPVPIQLSPIFTFDEIFPNSTRAEPANLPTYEVSFKPDGLNGLSVNHFILRRGSENCQSLDPKYVVLSKIQILNAGGSKTQKLLKSAEKDGFEISGNFDQSGTSSNKVSSYVDVSCRDINLLINSTTGLMQEYETPERTIAANIRFGYYKARLSHETSGAYLFLPGQPAQTLDIDPRRDPVFTIVLTGPIYSKVITRFPVRYGQDFRNTAEEQDTTKIPFLTHKLSVSCPSEKPVRIVIENDIDFTLSINENREIVMGIDTDLKHPSGAFYTDNNGLQIQKRVRLDKLPIQANFYPMPTLSYIQEESATKLGESDAALYYRLTLLTAQPLGVGSLKQGSLEVIMDRKFSQDDNRGLGEIVRDNIPYTNRFEIILENTPGSYGIGPSLKRPKTKEITNRAEPSTWLHTSISWRRHLSLLHPLITLQGSKSPNHLSPTPLPLFSGKFEMDEHVHLVNFKMFELHNENSVKAPLFVPARFKISCIFHSTLFANDLNVPFTKPSSSSRGFKVNMSQLLGYGRLWKKRSTLATRFRVRSMLLNMIDPEPSDNKENLEMNVENFITIDGSDTDPSAENWIHLRPFELEAFRIDIMP